jgi:hypothetical protein
MYTDRWILISFFISQVSVDTMLLSTSLSLSRVVFLDQVAVSPQLAIGEYDTIREQVLQKPITDMGTNKK